MWLCTKLGFFSIVRKAPDEFHVRARCENDLKNLRKAVAKHVHRPAARWKIHRSEPADYRFRIVVSTAYLQGVMQTLAMELDYSNFKGVIAQTDDQREKLPIYSDFHHRMERFQNAPAEQAVIDALFFEQCMAPKIDWMPGHKKR